MRNAYIEQTDSGIRKRPLPRPEEYPAPLPPRSPDRSSMSNVQPQTISSNYSSNRDYPSYYSGPDTKRQRGSVDMGARGLYDGDGRYSTRQVDAYQSHGTNAFQNQANAYQSSMLQGFPTTATGVSDYPIRQSHQGSTPTSFGSPDDPMSSMRSPSAGYMAQPRYQSYSSAQIPYNLTSSTQMPQMGDSTSSRSVQPSNMQGFVSGQSFSHPAGHLQSPSQVRQNGSAYPLGHSPEPSTGATSVEVMPQAYARPQYQGGSTILPPLQTTRPLVSPNSNVSARGYYDQSTQGSVTPVLPSQHGSSTNGERYGGGGQSSFDPPGSSSNTTPH
jgi:hypothetical protein